MGKQLGFFIDQSMCSGCNACVTACKDKNDLEIGRFFRRVSEDIGGEFNSDSKGYTNNVFAYYTSMACNHCDNPKCVDVCPAGAMIKRSEDGVVIVNQELCIGCKSCVVACPYEAPQYDENIKKMSKCDLCIDLIKKEEQPACVEACPFGLIEYGEIEDLRKKHGIIATTIGLPDPEETDPNLVIKPHKDSHQQ